MRRVSMATKDEPIGAAAGRYSEAGGSRGGASSMSSLRSGYDPQARDARTADRTDGGAARTKAWPSDLWRGDPGGAHPTMGSVRPAMRQAIKGGGAPRPARGAGVLAPSAATPFAGHWRPVARELAFGRTLQRGAGDSGADVHRLVRDPAPGFVGTLPAHPWRPATCVSWGVRCRSLSQASAQRSGVTADRFGSLYIERYIHQGVKHRINSGLRPILI
jgi:hypothetical protein